MPHTLSPHPDPQRLSDFGLGKLDDEATMSSIAAHVEWCAECRSRLQRLPSDTLENLVRLADTTPTGSADTQAIPKQLEYFRIEGVLGQGGMGTVYLADDTRLRRKVALKTLKGELAQKPQAKERFLREARAAANLEHDHVVPIYYVGEADGIPFLAMPLLKGKSLDDFLATSGGKLAIPRCLHIAQQVAAGLAAAH